MQVYEQYKQAEATTGALSRRVNRKVMAMFERAKAEYGELRRKKEVVENDRAKIQEVCRRAGQGPGSSYGGGGSLWPCSRWACACGGG